MTHKIHKSLARRVARHFRELHFFLRHSPLPWRGLESRRRNCILPGQFVVGQPPSEYRACGFGEPASIAIFMLALVISKRLLIQVTEQMERLDTDVSAFDAALEQRPKILDSVGVDVALHVSFGMVHELVDVILSESGVRRQFIGEQFRAACDVAFDLFMQGMALAILDMTDADLSGFAVKQADYQFLARAASAVNLYGPLIPVHVAGESADESLIGFNRAATAEFFKAATLHRLANPMHHKPSGLLGDAKVTPHFVGTNPILTVDDKPHGDKPLVERQRTILKDRTDLDRELPLGMIVLAFPQAPGGKKTYVFALASRASDAIRPAHRNQKIQRTITVRKEANSLDQAAWPLGLFLFHNSNIAGKRG